MTAVAKESQFVYVNGRQYVSSDLYQQAQDEIARLKAQVIFVCYEDEKPAFVQGYEAAESEVLSVLTASECKGFIDRIAELVYGVEAIRESMKRLL